MRFFKQWKFYTNLISIEQKKLSLINRKVSNNLLKLFRKLDWWLIITATILSFISLATIYSVDLSKGENLIYVPRQFYSTFYWDNYSFYKFKFSSFFL